MKYLNRLLTATLVAALSLSHLAWGEGDNRTQDEAIPTMKGDTHSVYWNIGPGLALYGGNTGWAINTGALIRVEQNSPIFVGADLGVDFWTFNSTTTLAKSSATGFQLLPTAIYRFRMADLHNFFPYVGVSVGPNVYVERSTSTAGVQTSATSVLFEALLRPGVYTSLTDSIALNIEAKFGVLRSEFIFLPQINAVILL